MEGEGPYTLISNLESAGLVWSELGIPLILIPQIFLSDVINYLSFYVVIFSGLMFVSLYQLVPT
jgi:hypothetical protein